MAFGRPDDYTPIYMFRRGKVDKPAKWYIASLVTFNLLDSADTEEEAHKIADRYEAIYRDIADGSDRSVVAVIPHDDPRIPF